MEDLIQQEKFEMEVLDRLQSRKMLSPLVFTGGTMLRLCFGLNRFSVDLDFWFVKKVDQKKFFSDLKSISVNTTRCAMPPTNFIRCFMKLNPEIIREV